MESILGPKRVEDMFQASDTATGIGSGILDLIRDRFVKKKKLHTIHLNSRIVRYVELVPRFIMIRIQLHYWFRSWNQFYARNRFRIYSRPPIYLALGAFPVHEFRIASWIRTGSRVPGPVLGLIKMQYRSL